MEDKTLVCKDCGKEFVFTVGEQEFFKEHGFENEPQRCKACRDARRNRRGRPAFHKAICTQCGAETSVPFEPRPGRPIYCSDCFAALHSS